MKLHSIALLMASAAIACGTAPRPLQTVPYSPEYLLGRSNAIIMNDLRNCQYTVNRVDGTYDHLYADGVRKGQYDYLFAYGPENALLIPYQNHDELVVVAKDYLANNEYTLEQMIHNNFGTGAHPALIAATAEINHLPHNQGNPALQKNQVYTFIPQYVADSKPFFNACTEYIRKEIRRLVNR